MACFNEISLNDLFRRDNAFDLFHDEPIAFAKGKGRVNGLTIGWGAFGVLWNKPTCTVYIHETRYSREIFDDAGTFSVCWFGPKERDAVKYYGTVSGRDEDKSLHGGLKIEEGIAPYANEAELIVFCRKMGQSKFDPESVDEGVRKWYASKGVHTLYQGDIVAIWECVKE